MKFHTQIAVISGNPIYTAVSDAMLGWLKEYHTEMLIWTGKEKYTLAEHEKIIERIAAHDPDGAEKMIKHLERSRALYALSAANPDQAVCATASTEAKLAAGIDAPETFRRLHRAGSARACGSASTKISAFISAGSRAPPAHGSPRPNRPLRQARRS